MTRSTPKTRQVALELVLKAAATVRGWESKSGGELIAEAEIVERWILTGDKNAKEKSPARKARAGTRRR
jgi:hypothetical protein